MNHASDIVRVSEIGPFKGIPQTNSLIVANVFGKQHKNVLQSIQNLECSPDFNRLNYQPIEYLDSRGRTYPAFQMTKDGFTMLAMGFTGKPAMEWKEKFIAAFNYLLEENARLVKQNEELIAQLQNKLSRAKSELGDASKQILYFCDDLEVAEKKEQMLMPKAEFYWAMCDARGLYSIADVAKMIGTNYNQLLVYLRSKELFLPDRPIPRQEAIDRKIFSVKLQEINKDFVPTAFFTPEGVDWIWREMREDEAK